MSFLSDVELPTILLVIRDEKVRQIDHLGSFKEGLLLHHILGLIEETCCLIIRFRDTVASIGEMWEASAEKYMDGT